jgi:hypothetical protein
VQWGRIAFAVAWIGVQGGLILTANRRPDGAFGFRMFSESTTIKVSLYREVAAADGTRSRVHVDDGRWSARDASGHVKRFSWHDRVTPNLAVFDLEWAAAYGEAAQLARWQGALDDVFAHTTDDAETKRLVLDVVVRKNGREPHTVTLESAERGAR